MKGDFTRLTFDRRKHYSRVLQQQGRVALDSDANESSAILIHHLRTLTRDLFGPFGGPADGNGFLLEFAETADGTALTIDPGHYYVDGILCENETQCGYAQQPDWTPAAPDASGSGGDPLLAWLRNPNPSQRFWIYLDVWERHISWIEDEHIREPALLGPDTCTRAKVVWQAKALPWDPAWDNAGTPCTRPLETLQRFGAAKLAARIDPGPSFTDPCIIAPGAAYRGPENHLYRVEIHRGGLAGTATFKWSRDNGSVATRWLGSEGAVLIAKSGRGFAAGDWVELSHDALDLAGLPGQLLLIALVDGDRLTIDPASAPASGQMAWAPELSNPKLRRWNQRGNDDVVLIEGAVPVQESTTPGAQWLDIEDGVQIQFAPGGQYRSGDYWLIPARVATQGIDWPLDASGHPVLQDPGGIEHHYAPLGIAVDNDGLRVDPCRRCVEIPETPCRVPAVRQNSAAPPAPARTRGRTPR
jgi:hypothetical protein